MANSENLAQKWSNSGMKIDYITQINGLLRGYSFSKIWSEFSLIFWAVLNFQYHKERTKGEN